MRAMKDSGIEWLGLLPDSWSTTKIDTLYTLRTEKVSDKNYMPLSVTMKGILPQLENVAKTDDGDNRKLVKAGDFVINSRSDRRGSCGISKYDGSVSLINTVLKPKDKMNPEYYNWLFHCFSFSDEFYRWGHGIVDDLWTTNWNDMKEITLPVPPFHEQNSIAVFLNHKCALIDKIVAGLESEIKLLKAYKQSLITETVTKGLDPEVEMKDSGVEWIGFIPKSWKVVSLRQIILKHNSGAWGTGYDEESGTICLRVADFDYENGKFKDTPVTHLTWRKYEPEQIEQLRLERNDILLEKSGGGAKTPVGRTVIFDKDYNAVCSNFIERIQVDAEVVHPYYAEYWLIALYSCKVTPFYINQTTGIQNIVLTFFLKHEKIAVPNMLEQTQIVEFLNKRCDEVSSVISEKQNQLSALNDYKKSLIYEYVTGKQNNHRKNKNRKSKLMF